MSMAMLPELPEESKVSIRVAAATAKAKISDARLHLNRAASAERRLEALEFAVCISGERFELEEERTRRVQMAAEGARLAATELVDAYGIQLWGSLFPEAEEFLSLLSAVGEQVERELACPELNRAIREAISARTVEWAEIASEKIRVRAQPERIPPASSASPQAGSAETYKTALACNIDKLRKECGFSIDDLAKAAGHGKKLTLGHLQGKGAHPSTLKTYADVFSEKLGQSVTVADLKRETD